MRRKALLFVLTKEITNIKLLKLNDLAVIQLHLKLNDTAHPPSDDPPITDLTDQS